MSKTEKIWLGVVILFAVVVLVTGIISYFFGVKVIASGEAYGFRIGDNKETTFKNAQALLKQNKIVAIHTWPKGEFHRDFEQEENPIQNKDKSWVMVVNPNWWNNTITVTYNNNAVVEIRRDRIYSELP